MDKGFLSELEETGLALVSVDQLKIMYEEGFNIIMQEKVDMTNKTKILLSKEDIDIKTPPTETVMFKVFFTKFKDGHV